MGGRSSRSVAATLALAAVAALGVAAAEGAKDETILVSRQSNSDGGAGGDNSSFDPSVSGDGRYVVFSSDADNLSASDHDAFYNVFVRDTQTGTTTLVSRQSDQAGGASGDGDSYRASASADGRYVAFQSSADNLSGSDNDALFNVFVRDMQTGTTTLVSRQSDGDGGQGADGGSFEPSVSDDGRYVAFGSSANNLSGSDNDAFSNVFVRDMQTGTTTLVSRRSSSDGGEGADGDSFEPWVSGDGRYVGFESDADNLSGDDNNAVQNVFVRDMQTGTTTLVSRQSSSHGGDGADGYSYRASVSGDGRYVAFVSYADNLSGSDNDAFSNVFMRDVQTGTTTLVSRQSDGGDGADGDSRGASVSADARYVGFSSDADNLSGSDYNQIQNVFVRDMQTGATMLVSRQSSSDGGDGANGESHSPSVSTDGRYVAFASDADNLGGSLFNSYDDVYERDVLGPPPPSSSPPSSSPTPTPAPAQPPASAPAYVDMDPPDVSLSGPKLQALRKRVVVFASCDEPCTALGSGTISLPGAARTFRLGRATKSVAAGARVKLALRLPVRARRAARAALRAGRKVRVRVTVKTTDAAANWTSARRTVKLKRR